MGEAEVALTSTTPATERLTALFDAHAERLHRLARRLTPSADAALDLVQDVFLRAARAPGSVPHGHRDEEAWLVRVLVNLRRDQWRKESVRRREAAQAGPPATETANPEPAYVHGLTVWRALDVLSPRRRAILVLHELDAMPAPAIAALLGITTITVRWHLARGRRELATCLRDRGTPHGQPDAAVAGR